MKYKKCKCAKCGSEILRVYKRENAECFQCKLERNRQNARKHQAKRRQDIREILAIV